MNLASRDKGIDLLRSHFMLFFGGCFAISSACLFLLIDSSFAGLVTRDPLNLYSFLMLAMSGVLVIAVSLRNRAMVPSGFLLLLFFLTPFVGISNYHDFVNVHGSFYGQQAPSFRYPVFIWSVGTLCFFSGVAMVHFLFRARKTSSIVIWDLKRVNLFLWLTLGLALFATIIAVSKIGYIPLLKRSIAMDRLKYVDMMGPLVWRFSNLWLVSGVLASMLFYLEKKQRYCYALIAGASAVGMTIYGQRTGLVLICFAFGLFYLKFCRLRLRDICVISVITAFILGAFVIQGEIRSGRDVNERNIRQMITANLFHEWIYYSYVVDDNIDEKHLLGGEIFWGQLGTLVPRQVFDVFGYDKEKVVKKYNAAFYFGEKFNDPYGIRITPIGEAFVGYGTLGVIFQMCLFGLYVGVLETLYNKLDKRDARLSLVCFLFCLTLYLPLGMLYMILAPIPQQGLFLGIFYLLASRKRNLIGADGK